MDAPKQELRPFSGHPFRYSHSLAFIRFSDRIGSACLRTYVASASAAAATSRLKLEGGSHAAGDGAEQGMRAPMV